MTLPNGLLTLVESIVLLGGVSMLLLRRLSNLAGKPPSFPDDPVDSRLEKWLPSEDQPQPGEAPPAVDATPYCPTCGQRNFGKPVCEKCGLDFASPAALRPPEPVTGPSPTERVLFGTSGTESLWPDVTQEWGPERAAKQGMLAAFFCAGLTLLPLASSAPASGGDAAIRTGAILLAAAYAMLGLLIWKRLLVAAIAAPALFVFDRMRTFEKGDPRVLLLGLILALCFVNGIRGAAAGSKNG